LPASGFNDCVSHNRLGEKKAVQTSTGRRSWQTQSSLAETAL
jgi:hypothetical protein